MRRLCRPASARRLRRSPASPVVRLPDRSGSFEESARFRHRGTNLIVIRVVEREHLSQFGAKLRLHIGRDQPLLILLLRDVPAAIEAVERAARRGSMIFCPSMPQVRVHDYYSTGWGSYQDLIRMHGFGIGQVVLRPPAQSMRARDDSQ